MTNLREEFPEVKIISTPDGFLGKCRCYEARRNGVKRVTFKEASIPALRAAIRGHVHRLSFADAKSEVDRMARGRRDQPFGPASLE